MITDIFRRLTAVVMALVIVVGWLLVATPVLADGEEIRIGVLAKRGPSKALSRWEPTADYLSASIPDHTFRVVPLQFDEIPRLVKSGDIDFLITNPAMFVDLSVRFGLRRILTLKNRLSTETHVTRFGSAVVVRRDRKDLATLAGLKGRRLAAVHRASLGGWMMALREFRALGLEEGDFASVEFPGTHDAVVEAVRDGRVDAGIVRTDTLERMAADGKAFLPDYRVLDARHSDGFPFLHSTRLYPEWPIAALADTPEDLAEAVAAALIALPHDHPAAKAAKVRGWTIPENYEPVHEILREMGLPPYRDYGKVSLRAVLRTYSTWLIAFGIGFLALLLLGVRIGGLNRALVGSQEKLERSEARFRATFEQAAVGVAHARPDGRFTLTNKRFSEITGYPPSELAILTLGDLAGAEDTAREMERLATLESGETEHFTLQKRLLGRDGLRRWVLQTVSCFRDAHGTVQGLVVVLDDIDQLKALEREIHREREQRELVLNVAGDGIIGLDTAARHSFVNPAAARMLGWEVDEMLGRHSHRMWHHTHADGSDYPEQDCPIASVLADGVVHRGVGETFWRKDESSFPAEYISTPIFDGGRAAGAVVVFRDISERAELEESLRRSNRELEQFAYIASHDLQEPLRMVNSYLQLLERRYSDGLDDTAREFIAYATDGAVRMQGLIRDLLEYSRVTTKGKEPAPVEAGDCLSSALENLRIAIEEADGAVSVDTLPRVMADESQLIRLFQNLVGNALKYRDKDRAPSIRVGVARRGGDWAFSVRDNGIGIAPGDFDRVFQVFQRLHGRGDYEGTGIGLAVCKKIVERHGGEIWLESEPGQGTTFHFTLPKA